MRYNAAVFEKPTPLSEAIASLRTATQADAARGIHALILALLAKLFTRLEQMIQLWQSGQLPTPQPRVNTTSKTIHPATTPPQEPTTRHAPSRRHHAPGAAVLRGSPAPSHQNPPSSHRCPTTHAPCPPPRAASIAHPVITSSRPPRARAPPPARTPISRKIPLKAVYKYDLIVTISYYTSRSSDR